MPAEISFKLTSNRLDGELQRALREKVKRTVQQSGDRIVQDARGLVAVDTGMTRDSIDHDVSEQGSGFELTVSADRFGDHPEVPGILEYGGAGRPARPFLRPAADAERPRFQAEMRKVVKELER